LDSGGGVAAALCLFTLLACGKSELAPYVPFGDAGESPTNDTVTGLPPARFVRVFAGGTMSCGIRDDGRAVCWGLIVDRARACEYRDAGLECWNFGVEDPPPEVDTAPPSEEVVDIDLSWHRACALRSDHSVVCWGGSRDVVQGDLRHERYVDIAMALHADYGLLPDGTLQALSSASCTSCAGPPPEGEFTEVVSEQFGPGFACAVSVDGEVRCWGETLLPSPLATKKVAKNRGL
jgi:hypothetical protein